MDAFELIWTALDEPDARVEIVEDVHANGTALNDGLPSSCHCRETLQRLLDKSLDPRQRGELASERSLVTLVNRRGLRYRLSVFDPPIVKERLVILRRLPASTV